MTGGPGEIELPRLRQGLYRFFAAALLPPQATRLNQLDPAADLLQELGVDTLAFAEPWLDMRQALATRPSPELLEAEYVRLFESGSDPGLCPALESFYVSSPRRGGPGGVTADLKVEYQRLGMAVAGGLPIDVDHICPQLELMGLLCANEGTAVELGDLEAVAKWNHEQRQFMDKHLGRWLPCFAARVRQLAPRGLYRELIVTLDAFIDHDHELLRILDRRERPGPGL